MKVLLINGSPRIKGNTHLALTEISKTLTECGIDSEIVWIGNKPVRGCIACCKCYELGHCVFRDELMVEMEQKVSEADAIVVGSPVYYAGPNGSLCALLDRLFYSYGSKMRFKPAASVAVCRRGGASATFDRLNKYFSINNMPIVSSQYWNIVYGRAEGEALQDGEGMQTMRTLARNMAWILKNLNNGVEQPPQLEPRSATNFIR
ncbi:MAG: flavodoxin family protein [Muribaculaceae bacterium]|nr:flavodoxin family protein [Muribaculaceae bacterium]